LRAGGVPKSPGIARIKNSYRKLAVHSAAAAVTCATELNFFDGRR
jgi:hypothetical protein